ncbi:MAG: hypothetical protein JW854_05630 [Actinobacteria bacterium]|nr:hypothetical protein [Actinomycetota bacterium]
MEYKKETIAIEGSWNMSSWEWKFESIALIRKVFEAMKEGKLIANKCPGCGMVYFMPKPYCRCLSEPDEFVEIKDTATVTTYTFTGSWAYEGISDEEVSGTPLIFAGIVFDGSNTMTVANIEGVEPDQVSVGMRVKLKWPDKVEGTLNDLARCVPL